MKRWEVVPATREHAENMAPNLRKADREEIWKAGRETPIQALLHSLHFSMEAYTCMSDDAPIAMVGVVRLPDDVGVPWLLGTSGVDNHKLTFARTVKRLIDEWLTDFVHLENFVDADYQKSIDWIKWMGFELTGPYPHGPEGELFLRFYQKGKLCAQSL